ncbi:hypothetical protein O3P69_001644 [Scylla paramamosain]|uniref:Cadherin domain-containing protein n=1 Tax=Scylla paramamosain TaxID=85552 RepID=A0AAW0V148_SCYPA
MVGKMQARRHYQRRDLVTRLVGSDPVEFEKQKYVVEVPENSASVPLLRLTVKLNPPGKVVKFRIKSGNEGGYFSLEDTSGRLSLARPLDYESQTQVRRVMAAKWPREAVRRGGEQ